MHAEEKSQTPQSFVRIAAAKLSRRIILLKTKQQKQLMKPLRTQTPKQLTVQKQTKTQKQLTVQKQTKTQKQLTVQKQAKHQKQTEKLLKTIQKTAFKQHQQAT